MAKNSFSLVRLKVGLLVEDLAVRFSISVGSVSSIFNSWVNPERAL
jgi:hypothetical protein